MINSQLEWSPTSTGSPVSQPQNGASGLPESASPLTILSPNIEDFSKASLLSTASQYRSIVPSESYRRNSYLRRPEEYERLYRLSIQDPATFWYEIAKEFYWKRAPTRDKVIEYNFDIRKGPIFTKWFQNGSTNICYNALDRHIKAGFGSKIAYHW